MEKDMNNNEELQSRREFFKKAAKSALPILAAVALANVPVIAEAAGTTPSGCNYDCLGSCDRTCSGSCDNSCNSTCKNGCQTSCRNACQTSCKGACQGHCGSGCSNACNASCGGCSFTCYQTCQEGAMTVSTQKTGPTKVNNGTGTTNSRRATYQYGTGSSKSRTGTYNNGRR